MLTLRDAGGLRTHHPTVAGQRGGGKAEPAGLVALLWGTRPSPVLRLLWPHRPQDAARDPSGPARRERQPNPAQTTET